MVAAPAGGAPLLVVLPGPTASGKTALAIALARRFGGEIVSCDSVAIYRELDIGSAKPTHEELSLAPHHMIGVAAPDAAYTAGDYSRDARRAIAEIAARGRLPVVTGGSGLYLRALLEGLFPGPRRSEALRERLRRTAEKRGAAWLHRMLGRMDAASAARIHANDLPKTIRAIEVSLEARQPMSEAWKAGRDPLTGYRIVRIGLDPERSLLYERINQRAAAMFSGGLVEETRALLEKYGPDCRSLDSLGYRQVGQFLRGELSLDEAVAAARQGHRNYAKRQMTWFRREPDMTWLRGFGADAAIGRQAEERIARAMDAPG